MLHGQKRPSRLGSSLCSKSDDLPPLVCRLDVVSSKTLLRVLSQPLPLSLAKIASLLSERRGAIVARDQFVTEIWGERASGGPLSAEAMIGLYVALLRTRGLRITTFRARGYGIGHR
jgi:DNA-binding winged helix-turn-helix (wHTH) protein